LFETIQLQVQFIANRIEWEKEWFEANFLHQLKAMIKIVDNYLDIAEWISLIAIWNSYTTLTL